MVGGPEFHGLEKRLCLAAAVTNITLVDAIDPTDRDPVQFSGAIVYDLNDTPIPNGSTVNSTDIKRIEVPLQGTLRVTNSGLTKKTGDGITELPLADIIGTDIRGITVYGPLTGADIILNSVLTVPSITISGNYIGDIVSQGPVKSISIKGNRQGYTEVNGNLGSFAAGSIDGDIIVNGNAGTITSSGGIESHLKITGSLKTLSAKGNLEGSVEATTLGTASGMNIFADISAKNISSITCAASRLVPGSGVFMGDVSALALGKLSAAEIRESNVTVAQNINTLSSKYGINSVIVLAGGNIGSISAKDVTGCYFTGYGLSKCTITGSLIDTTYDIKHNMTITVRGPAVTHSIISAGGNILSGNFTNLDNTLVYAGGNIVGLNVVQNINNSQVVATYNINPVSFANAYGSTFVAGINRPSYLRLNASGNLVNSDVAVGVDSTNGIYGDGDDIGYYGSLMNISVRGQVLSDDGRLHVLEVGKPLSTTKQKSSLSVNRKTIPLSETVYLLSPNTAAQILPSVYYNPAPPPPPPSF